jgi:hypothetical protein
MVRCRWSRVRSTEYGGTRSAVAIWPSITCHRRPPAIEDHLPSSKRGAGALRRRGPRSSSAGALTSHVAQGPSIRGPRSFHAKVLPRATHDLFVRRERGAVSISARASRNTSISACVASRSGAVVEGDIHGVEFLRAHRIHAAPRQHEPRSPGAFGRVKGRSVILVGLSMAPPLCQRRRRAAYGSASVSTAERTTSLKIATSSFNSLPPFAASATTTFLLGTTTSAA